MDLELNGKKVLITGGTSGIGLAAAKEFLALGAKVAINGRDGAKGEKALQSLRDGEAFFIQGDVASANGCKQLITSSINILNGLDILVNSAGSYLEKEIEAMEESDLKEIMGVNLEGTYWSSVFAVNFFKTQRRGSIINISSDAGLNGNYCCTAYCASKGAVISFTKALALETAMEGIRVNCICPGDIITPMTNKQLNKSEDREKALKEMSMHYPMQRIGTPEEVASIICFIASAKASFITGSIITVDGGLTAC